MPSPRYLVCSGLLAALALAACTRYQPHPLTTDDTDAALRLPDPARLTAAAAALHHPRLAPVVLDPAVPLTPESAAVVAVLVHPQLRAARAQRGLADAQLIQADILPNPQVTGAFDRPITGDTESAFTGWSVGLSWEVTSFITRGAKQRSAKAAYQSIDLAIAWQEWQVAAAARQAVVRLAGARERLPLALEQERLAQEGHELHQRALAMGAITKELMVQIDSAWADARATRIDAESEVEKERLNAVRSLGFPVDHPLPVAMPTMSPGPTTEPSQSAITDAAGHLESQRLDLAGLRAGYEAQEETLHAAVLGQFPKITLGITRARDTTALGLLSPGVAIDLPIFDRGQGAIASADADRTRLRAEYIQRVFEARHDLAEAEAELINADRHWREAQDALQRATVREQDLRAASVAQVMDAMSLLTARGECVRRASETSLWRQRHGELRIAMELAAGCLFPSASTPAAAAPHVTGTTP